ncbi:hypothetical protein [Lysobacter sp. Hz 25]|uniref:hypothetical protein n=1 Tax=Lysobacter sp. Hz 25 TaxID=3383698 RepID=UPI0038D413B4
MTIVSLDDQLKLAQIRKVRVETKKMACDIANAPRQLRIGIASEWLKIIAGIVVGVIGSVAVYSEFRAGKLVVENIKREAREAEALRDRANAEAGSARKERDQAFRDRDRAIKEGATVSKELKQKLTYTTAELGKVAPQLVQSRLTYIQFRGALPRDLINDLRANLGKDHFDAPGAERVAKDYSSHIKYFSPSDQPDAERLKQSVVAFFNAKGCPLLKLPTILPKDAPDKPLPLEVWISHSCIPVD